MQSSTFCYKFDIGARLNICAKNPARTQSPKPLATTLETELKMKYKFTLLLFLLSKLSFGQIDDSKFRPSVLKKNIIGKEFTFGECDQKGGYETILTYLGSVKTKKGKTYKIMNSIWIWGMSCRATHRILIFNSLNQYLGNYYMNSSCDLPTELKDGQLIFNNFSQDCDNQIEKPISFKNGIPKNIFGYKFES